MDSGKITNRNEICYCFIKNYFYRKRKEIPPEQEICGHFSNLQAWIENDYDTRLLSSNLAFPLLQKLAEVGDPQAKKVFKEEIVKRLMHGYPTTTHFLVNGKYLDYFTQEELLTLLNLCNDNLKSDTLMKNKRAGFHALFFGLRRKLGLNLFEEWRDNQKKAYFSREDPYRGFIFL